MARQSVGIRLDVLGKPEVIDALRETGAAGEKMAKSIEGAGPPASRGLLAVDQAAGQVRERLDDVAASAGPVGDALMQFGTAGKIAAVGIGGLTLAFGAMVVRGREATRVFAEIADQADVLGVTTTVLQRVQEAALTAGLDGEQTVDLLAELAMKAAEAREGGNEAAESFERLGVAVTDSAGRLRPLEAILSDVAEGMAAVENPIERIAIASALLGDEGRALIPVLAQGADGFKRLGDEAEASGLVIEEGIIRSAQSLNEELETQWRIIDTQLNVAMGALAPLFQDLLTAVIPLIKGVRDLSDAWRDVSRQGDESVTRQYKNLIVDQVQLTRQIADLEERLANSGRGRQGAPLMRLNEARAELAANQVEVEALRAELVRRAEARKPAPWASSPGTPGDVVVVPDDPETARLRLEVAALKKRLADLLARGGGGGGAIERVDLRAGASSPLPAPRGMTGDEYAKSIELQIKIEKARTDEIERNTAAMQELRVRGVQSVTSSLADFALGLQSGEETLKRFLSDLASDLPGILFGADGTQAKTGPGALVQGVVGSVAKSGISALISGLFGVPSTALLGGASGSGAARSGLMGDGLRGFASGGSFDVSSATSLGRTSPRGGDDQLVAFRAQMGERVTVTPRGQSAGGAPSINVTIVVEGDATDATIEKFRRVAAQEISRAAPSLTAQAVTATDSELRKNPDFGR